MSERSSSGLTVLVLLVLGLIALLFIGGLFWAGPQYSLYVKETQGKAQLAAAKYTKQIREADAEARAIAAKQEAEAIITVGKALEQYPLVIQKDYIDSLRDAGANGDRTVVYVPMINGMPQALPLPEAGRVVNKG